MRRGIISVISAAMFGLTAGAVWVYLRGERFTEKTGSPDLLAQCCAFQLDSEYRIRERHIGSDSTWQALEVRRLVGADRRLSRQPADLAGRDIPEIRGLGAIG